MFMAEFFMLVIQPLFEGDRKYATFAIILVLIWGLPRIPLMAVPYILGVVAIAVAIGLAAYVAHIRRLDREDDLVHQAAVDYALDTIPEGELPPGLNDDPGRVDRILEAAGIQRRLDHLVEAAESGYRVGATQRFAALFWPAVDETKILRLGFDEMYDAYVRRFGSDLRWVPYMAQCIKERFGIDVPDESCRREVKLRIARISDLPIRFLP